MSSQIVCNDHGESRSAITDRPTSPQSTRARTPYESLVERSINAWQDLYWRSSWEPEERREAMFRFNTEVLQKLSSIDELCNECGTTDFFFFQQRESFLGQERFQKWDEKYLDQYILVPTCQGFVTRKDCFFVSHYWRRSDHPDPNGDDFRRIKEDLASQKWSYIWIDWTCLPQKPRTIAQKKYFRNTLEGHMTRLLQHCGFSWNYPIYMPRMWILFEVAEYHLNCKGTFPAWFETTPDMERFVTHIYIMTDTGDVRRVLDTFGYKCSNQKDWYRIVSWLEVCIILLAVFPDDIDARRDIADQLHLPTLKRYHNIGLNMYVSKVDGYLDYGGDRFFFTPFTYNDKGEAHGPSEGGHAGQAITQVDLSLPIFERKPMQEV